MQAESLRSLRARSIAAAIMLAKCRHCIFRHRQGANEVRISFSSPPCRPGAALRSRRAPVRCGSAYPSLDGRVARSGRWLRLDLLLQVLPARGGCRAHPHGQLVDHDGLRVSAVRVPRSDRGALRQVRRAVRQAVDAPGALPRRHDHRLAALQDQLQDTDDHRE